MTEKIGNSTNQLECNFCKKQSLFLKQCSICKSTFYCNPSCQKNDWPKHKQACENPDNPTTKKTDNLGPKILKTDKTPKINIDPYNWDNFCSKTPLHFLINILENGKNSKLMKKLSEKNSLKLLMAYLGMLVAKLQDRLFYILKEKTLGKKLYYNENYYNDLKEENYINISPYNGPLSLENTLKKGYALIGREHNILVKEIFLTTPIIKYSICKITEKGKENSEKIQKIALETILNLLELYFSELIEINNTNFKTVLKDETFDALFKHRKSFLFDEIIFKLFKNKNRKNLKEFKRKIKEYKIKKITKEELIKILHSYKLT